jgi:excisionase family DNA binding protein
MAHSQPERTPYLTTRQIADQLSVEIGRVCDWINQGELRAVNVVRRVSMKPRWRVSPEALEAFLRRRQSYEPPPPRQPRNYSVNDGRGKVVRPDDGRLVNNVPHEVRVRRLAKTLASRRGGWGAPWKPLLDEAVERYARKQGVRVDPAVILATYCEEE